MLNNNLKLLSLSDIDNLISNSVPESRTLEYKQEIPTKKSSDINPFLASICAFANTKGGDIILGIKAKDGIPLERVGAFVKNCDSEKLRLSALIRDRIEPQVPVSDILMLETIENTYIVVIRILRSISSPHRIKINSGFYMRSINGNYPLDSMQIRDEFLVSNSRQERVDAFRRERVDHIFLRERLPVPISSGSALALHILPLSFQDHPYAIDVSSVHSSTLTFPPMNVTGWNSSINYDGIVYFDGAYNADSRRYTQLYRNGAIEAVSLLPAAASSATVPLNWVENTVIKYSSIYLDSLRRISVQFPYFLSFSILDILDNTPAESIVREYDEFIIKHNDLIALYPSIYIDNSSISIHNALRFPFNMLWNSFGIPKSPNYTIEGKRILHRR